MKKNTVTLGKYDCAVIIRCKGMKGPVRHELMVPKGDPLPVSVNDLLACAMLFGSSPKAKRVRAFVQDEMNDATTKAKRRGK